MRDRSWLAFAGAARASSRFSILVNRRARPFVTNLFRMYYELTDRFQVPASIEQTWAFFSNAENLPRITPPWLKFSVAASGPIEIKLDSILDYTICWKGVPIKWRTRIIDFTPPRQFIDLQIRGPYALWHHQHTFEPAQRRRCVVRGSRDLPHPQRTDRATDPRGDGSQAVARHLPLSPGGDRRIARWNHAGAGRRDHSRGYGSGLLMLRIAAVTSLRSSHVADNPR